LVPCWLVVVAIERLLTLYILVEIFLNIYPFFQKN